MNEHALDAMIYAWTVLKEKEENKMEGIFMGQIVGSTSNVSESDGKRCANIYFHDTESNACSKLSHYNKTYSLVLSDDVIMANDELLKLRDEVKELKIQIEMMEAANADQAKTFLTVIKSRDYFEEKADSVEKKYWELMAEHTKLQEEHTKLEDELAEIKTTRTLREAYIAGVEKGCESLREERDMWKRRWNSVVTDIGKSLESNGIEFTLKEIHGDGNWDVVIDIPELNEAKDKIIELEQKVRDERKWCDYWRHTYYAAEKVASVVGVSIKIDGIESQHNSAKVVVQNDKAEELKKQVVQMEDLEKKLKTAKCNETYWRDRKEEEEEYHHYWLHTFDRAVEQAADKGIHIDVRGTDEDCNAGVVVVDNVKAEDLKKQVVQMEDANQKLRQRISSADEEIEKLKNQHTSRSAVYWRNTYYSAVEKAKEEGVTIAVQGSMDLNADLANLKVTNEKAIELMVKVSDTKHEYNKKWQAMLNALKAKGVEVIYMGEQDSKPCVDVKIPGWDSDKEWVTTFSKQCADLRGDKFGLESERDELKEQCDILRKDGVLKGQQCLKLTADLNDLKKEYGRVLSELAELKSKTVAEARYEWKPTCFTLIYTMCDGSKQTTGADLSHEHINCLCKNYVPVHEGIDATAISCGTVPKCSSCAHYMHNPSRFAHDWCYMPIPKEGGAGYIRKLNKEEAEGPACVDFKAKE